MVASHFLIVFPRRQLPGSLTKYIYILNFALEPADILRKVLQVVAYHMARARIFNKTGACVFLETEVDSNRLRMKCTMSKMHICI